MAERGRAKAKPPATTRRRSEGHTAVAPPADGNAQRIKTLEGERERLKAQLADAEARISELEASRAETVNRIDWVLDSLHNVLEKGA